MRLKGFILPITLAAVLTAGTAPAFAQRHGGDDRGGRSGEGRSGGNRGDRGRSGDHGRSARANDHRDRDHGRAAVRVYPRYDRRYVRVYRSPSYYRYYRGPFVRTRIIHPYYRPYYVFRPRFSLGFGLFIGDPVIYPWNSVGISPYPYPYAASPYPYAAPQQASPYGPYAVQPSPYGSPYGSAAPQAAPAPNQPDDEDDVEPGDGDQVDLRNFGGVSLDIQPSDATVTVDGEYAGTVADFSPSSAPLTMVPGAHRIVIAKPGYRSMTFDANVVVGQVIPYQGRMQLQ